MNALSSEHFDALETRDPAARAAAQAQALPAQIARAKATAAMSDALRDIDPASIASQRDLAALPVTRKHELFERQAAARRYQGNTGPFPSFLAPLGGPDAKQQVWGHSDGDPFGGFSAIGWAALQTARSARRVFQSPGPIYEPEGHAADYWRFARALFAAGIRRGDLVHNSFSYHLTPAGAMVETAAHAIGCTVFPGGVGNTELQLQAIADLRPQAYAGTPSFLRILFEKADEAGTDLKSLTKASVGGEGLPPALRDALRARGVEAYQNYGSADLGLIAYETAARVGLVVDEGVIVEIVRPGGSEPLPEGEVGEVVVTTLNPDYPLVRFGTGDLSAVLPGGCPTGRTNTRIKGWLGRADQSAKVRGMFVHAAQVAEVLRRHPEVLRARLVIEGELANDRMTLHAECASKPQGLADALAMSLRDITKLRGAVVLAAAGSLLNDGKVIEDARKLE